jgi:hypothetical protein
MLTLKDASKKLAALLEKDSNITACRQGWLEFEKNRRFCILIGDGLFVWSKEVDATAKAEIDKLKKNLEGCFDLSSFKFVFTLRINESPYSEAEKKKNARLQKLISERSVGRDDVVSFFLATADASGECALCVLRDRLQCLRAIASKVIGCA